MLILISLCFYVIGLGVYIFREYIRENVADEVSTVASRSLGDTNVKLKAQELAVALLNAILEDETTQQQTGTVEPVLKDHLIGHKKIWPLNTGGFW